MRTLPVRSLLIVAAIFGQYVVPGEHAAAKSVSLAALTPWNVNYGEKICTLRRAFGTSEKPTVMIMDRFGPTDSFQLTIMGDEFASFAQGQAVQLQFGEQPARRMASVIPGKTASGTKTLFFPTCPFHRQSRVRTKSGTLQ